MIENLDDELERANLERQQIIERYKSGRNNLNLINKWEDPDFGEYYKIDRYGFIHPEALPTAFDDNELREKEVEYQREQKWLKMVKNWNKFASTEKVQRRIFKGIPDKLRRNVWLKLLNVEETKSKNRDEYERMLKLAKKYCVETRQIDNDINRCFRDHEYFCKRYSTKQQQLFNVLIAYSMFNSEIGYCQGMSTVVAVLLIYLDEEESFWAIHNLMVDRKYAMHGLYIVGFPKLMRFLTHHDKILTKFLPKLKKQFDKQNLDAVLYSLKWFFVIFVERIPFSLCLRVLDIYFLYGERVVVAMSFTILKLHASKLLKFKDMDNITEYIQYKLQKNFGYTDNYVIKKLEENMIELKQKRLDLPPPPGENELPKREMGLFIEPTIEKKLGLRSSCFTDTEKNVTEYVISRTEENGNEIDTNEDQNTFNNLSTADCTTAIRRFKSMNSLNTATSIATSIDSIPSEVNIHDLDTDSDGLEIIEITRL